MHYILMSFFIASWGTASCVSSAEEVRSILLTEFTRGTNRSIEATPTTLTVVVNGKTTSSAMKPESWKTLLHQASQLPLSDLESVPILSKKHQVDAALHATLKFDTGKDTFTSPTFDHNAPPDAFKPLVNTLYQQVPSAMKASFGQ